MTAELAMPLEPRDAKIRRFNDPGSNDEGFEDEGFEDARFEDERFEDQ